MKVVCITNYSPTTGQCYWGVISGCIYDVHPDGTGYRLEGTIITIPKDCFRDLTTDEIMADSTILQQMRDRISALEMKLMSLEMTLACPQCKVVHQ
jgi:formylmethanofuran dehydrogenase subunit B